MEGQSGLSELSVISWVSAFEGCPLSGVPLYVPNSMLNSISIEGGGEREVGGGGIERVRWREREGEGGLEL